MLFFLLPLVIMALRSVTDPGPENYLIFTRSAAYGRVLGTTLWTSVLVTVVCLLIGYPYAYVMHHAGPRLATVLGVAVLLPFWSSLLVRTYAWTVLLQTTGVINSFLRGIGLIDEPIQLMRNTLGVQIGMSYILLPFMVLPIYAVMRRIDPDLTPAAAGLGAGPVTAFRRVCHSASPASSPGSCSSSSWRSASTSRRPCWGAPRTRC